MEKNKKSILIVEDDSALRQVLTDKLSEEGFTVWGAIDGAQGLKLANEKHPSLILLDIFMPIMDGVTMLKKLREDEWGKLVKVIVLSNLSDDSALARSMEKGVYDYLVKTDWKLEDVVAKIKERLVK